MFCWIQTEVTAGEREREDKSVRSSKTTQRNSKRTEATCPEDSWSSRAPQGSWSSRAPQGSLFPGRRLSWSPGLRGPLLGLAAAAVHPRRWRRKESPTAVSGEESSGSLSSGSMVTEVRSS